jgi:Kef-type K+ transport system membrane component KefB
MTTSAEPASGPADGPGDLWSGLADLLQIDPWPPSPGVLFWLALALVAGGWLGEVARRALGIPRIVGYGAVGMMLAAAGLGVQAELPAGMPPALRLVLDLALGVLLFELGSRVRLAWLRSNPALLATGVLESALSLAAVLLVMRLSGFGWAASLTAAAILVPVSAAVVGQVAGELGAAGQVTDRLGVLTALNTLFGVMAHRLLSGWLQLDHGGDWLQALLQPLWVLVGSAALAALLARLIALVARRLDLRDDNTVLLLLGLIVLAQLGARQLGLSTLLLPLLAGVLLRNTHARPWVWPRHFGTAGGVLVLMLFIVVGAAWSPQAMAAGLGVALAVLVARAGAKWFAVQALARHSGLAQRQGLGLSLALLPISGTSLVLFLETAATHPPVAAALAPVLLTALGLMELLGPMAVQWGLRVAREIPPEDRS